MKDMKVEKTYKIPSGTLILTDSPIPLNAYKKKVKIKNKLIVVNGTSFEDESAFTIKENISNIDGEEIEFVN